VADDDYNAVRNQRIADVAQNKNIQHTDVSGGTEMLDGILPRGRSLKKTPTDHTQSKR